MHLRLSRVPARRCLPRVHLRLWRWNRWLGWWNRWLRWRVRGQRKWWKPGHLHLQLSVLSPRRRVRGLQLRVQRGGDNDDDRPVGDGHCDGNWDGLQLGLGNRGGLRVPGVPGRDLVPALQLRLTASAAHRSLLGSHRRDQLRRRHGRLLRLGSARDRVRVDEALSVGNLRSDERRLGRRFHGSWLRLRLRCLSRRADLPSVQLQLLPADTNSRDDLHDGH